MPLSPYSSNGSVPTLCYKAFLITQLKKKKSNELKGMHTTKCISKIYHLEIILSNKMEQMTSYRLHWLSLLCYTNIPYYPKIHRAYLLDFRTHTTFPNTTPMNDRPYQYPHFRRKKLNWELLVEMLRVGITLSRQNGFFLPSFVSLKKWWVLGLAFCVEYKALNITIKDRFPIPTID